MLLATDLIPGLLVSVSAAVALTLGLIHLMYTFTGTKLTPRDRDVQTRMETALPVITRQTTMWKAWIGFNASHSLGAILFGAVYGYLALLQSAVLFRSVFLGALGAVFLTAYLLLARKYWFRAPFRGVLFALIFYAAGFAASLAQSAVW